MLVSTKTPHTSDSMGFCRQSDPYWTDFGSVRPLPDIYWVCQTLTGHSISYIWIRNIGTLICGILTRGMGVENEESEYMLLPTLVLRTKHSFWLSQILITPYIYIVHMSTNCSPHDILPYRYTCNKENNAAHVS